jgi:AraC-like DNA-binding protein
LYSTDVKIKNVAVEIGYEDPYYFSRLFKKYMNVSPDQYRTLRKIPEENIANIRKKQMQKIE